MRFASIASGSSGNSTYIGSDKTHILIDAGVSSKRIVTGLHSFDIKPEEITAVLITHEHSDHISGLKTFLKKYNTPIYATAKTIEFIKNTKIISDFNNFNTIKAQEEFYIGDLNIKPFQIPHDALEPVAFRVNCKDKSVAVATDMGYFSDDIVKNLRGVEVAIVEANHDIKLLECGNYPYALKRRILGDRGHLSNENAGKLISKILHDNIKHIFLGHLSKENNYPELAFETVKYEIDIDECRYKGTDFPIEIAKRDMPSRLIFI
jgi:vicX protein